MALNKQHKLYQEDLTNILSVKGIEVDVQVMRLARDDGSQPFLERNRHFLLYCQGQFLVDGHLHVGHQTHLIIDGIWIAAHAEVIIDDGTSDEEHEDGYYARQPFQLLNNQ